MIDYTLIDDELYQWAESKGITVQTKYRDDEVRSFFIRSSDNSQKAQIAVSRVDKESVELIVFDGRKKRERLSGPLHPLSKLLDDAAALAVSWV